jgi:hypothetical protein
MWDVVTEFDSLGPLASDMVPAYRWVGVGGKGAAAAASSLVQCRPPPPGCARRRKRLNTVHPAAGPAVANGVITRFLLAGAK